MMERLIFLGIVLLSAAAAYFATKFFWNGLKLALRVLLMLAITIMLTIMIVVGLMLFVGR